MPQLMPLFWMLSFLMITLLLIMYMFMYEINMVYYLNLKYKTAEFTKLFWWW